jgi:hypothetical protein
VVADALERLRDYAYIDGPGMAVHAPMGVEALCSLGLDDLVPAWTDGYRARLAPLPAPPRSSPIDPADPAATAAALGDPSRLSDWNDLFRQALACEAWNDVVARWVPRLLAGYAGALTHGLLRTAHAVRTLERVDRPAPILLDELAVGLAYWAGTYRELPGTAQLRGRRTLPEAIAAVPRPPEPWTPVEAGQFERLGELGDFPDAVAALGPPRTDDPLGELSLAFARVLVANEGAPPVGVVHSITPVVATRTLLNHVPELAVAPTFARLWTVGAGIVAGFVPPGGPIGVDLDALDTVDVPSPGDLLDRVADHRDPHAVKITEACLREHASRPDPAYLLAARRVLDAVPSW